jgi:hypothetical protein
MSKDEDHHDQVQVANLERKVADWLRDVVRKDVGQMGASRYLTKKSICNSMLRVEEGFEGYWCEGKSCECERTHWVMNESESHCWECLHDPCVCIPPLMWDKGEEAYYRVSAKKKVWMSAPTTESAMVEYNRREEQKKRDEKRKIEHDVCSEKQKKARKKGFCCHNHSREYEVEEQEQERKMKEVLKENDPDHWIHSNEEKSFVEKEEMAHKKGFCCHDRAIEYVLEKEEQKRMMREVSKEYGPDHCIHCDDEPCCFVQIESRLGENDHVYYNEQDFAKAPAAYNSSRRKRAFRYAASILWEGINYRKKHYTCVENGVRALFPPFNGKIMGYKKR